MPRAKGLCQKGAGDHEGNCKDRGTCAESEGAGGDGGSSRDQPRSTWMTMETLFIPITTAREPSKGYKQGSDRTGLRLERSPGLSGQVDLREELRCMGKNATNS